MSQLLYPPLVNAPSKQLNANYTAADAVITLTNTTNIQNKPGVCLINRVDTNGTLQATSDWTYIEFTATSGTTLTGCTAIAGDQDQALGKVVEFISDVTQQQRILDCLVAEHNDDGTHSAITATSIDIGSSVAVTATLDEDDMASNSATALATQQSIKAYVDSGTVADSDGATITFDLGSGAYRKHAVTLGGNRTLALSNALTGMAFIISLTQDGTGSRTVTWFSTIKWAGGSAPTLTTTASKRDVFGFICTGSGTYDGFVVGSNI